MADSPADRDQQYEDVFERHWLSVFRFALAWTNEWRSAEDIAQDTFLLLWKNRERVDWSRPILPWLLTTSRRLATDRFRRLHRTITLTPQAPAHADEDARVRWLDVQAAMASLSNEQRAAVVLRLVIGLDPETVAEILGTTPGAVRAAISRARERLAQE